MNCREAEKQIYLYAELGIREREETDKHVNTCAPCRQLLEAATAQRDAIVASFGAVPALADASAMTRRIMDAVQERQSRKASAFTLFAAAPSINLLRYGMAVVSLLLVTTFLGEYNGEKQIAQDKVMPATREAELNSASFHATFIATRAEATTGNTLFYECVVNCLYTPDGDCEDCRDRIKNLN